MNDILIMLRHAVQLFLNENLALLQHDGLLGRECSRLRLLCMLFYPLLILCDRHLLPCEPSTHINRAIYRYARAPSLQPLITVFGEGAINLHEHFLCYVFWILMML